MANNSGLTKYQEIYLAIPTDPDASGPMFEAFATLSNLSKHWKLQIQQPFSLLNKMVDQCMNCHTEFCPGPKKRIRKLYIK